MLDYWPLISHSNDFCKDLDRDGETTRGLLLSHLLEMFYFDEMDELKRSLWPQFGGLGGRIELDISNSNSHFGFEIFDTLREGIYGNGEIKIGILRRTKIDNPKEEK